MARYFFNIHDGIDLKDPIGSEHAGIASVRSEAIEAMSERTKGRLLTNSDSSTWIMNVTNEAGISVMIVTLAAAVQLLD